MFWGEEPSKLNFGANTLGECWEIHASCLAPGERVVLQPHEVLSLGAAPPARGA